VVATGGFGNEAVDPSHVFPPELLCRIFHGDVMLDIALEPKTQGNTVTVSLPAGFHSP